MVIDPGVIQGSISVVGQQESWIAHGNSPFTMWSFPRTDGSSYMPIAGQFNDSSYSGDLAVEVDETDGLGHISAFHDYSIPVSDGLFDSTIVLPYNGYNIVIVSLPDDTGSDGSFRSNQNCDFSIVSNSRPTLNDQQMSLLQSWMANYNEFPDFWNTAQELTRNQSTTVGKVKAVSDWVSQNINYNWAEANPGSPFLWQQASESYNKKLGVCQDEAAVAASMLRRIGIPTQVMQGELYDSSGNDLGPHAWDRAWNGSEWINFDPTLDQVYYSESSAPASISDSYFNISDAQLSLDHKDVSVAMW